MPCRRILIALGFMTLLAVHAGALTGEETIRSFYPCREGSENEFALIEFLIEDFTQRQMDFQIISYNDREGLHSFSRSLRMDFTPRREDRIYLAASLNGENDYSYLNTLLLYNLALTWQKENPEKGVTLLFLGGERNRVPIGTTAFLEDFTGEETGAIIYLDIDSPLLRVISSTTGLNTPLWLLKSFSQTLSREGIPFSLNGIKNLFNRAGFGESESLLTPWMTADVPALLLTGTPQKENPGISLPREEKLLESLLAFISYETEKLRDDRERNYLIVSVGKQSYFVGEWHSILTIITLLSLFTITVVFQSRNFILNFRKHRNQLWVMLLISTLVFILLYLSTLIMEEILLQKNIDDLWIKIPRDILFFKLLLTLLFSSFFLFIIRGIPIPRSPHFYSYGAILFATADLLILASQDISLTYYALWLLLCLFPFALSRKMPIKTLLTIVTPLPVLYLLVTVVLDGYPDLSRFLLMDRIEGNLMITAFVMPYILMLTSLHYSRFYYHRERRSYTALAIFVLVPAACIYILIRIILFSPFSNEQKQPFQITDTMDYAKGSRIIELKSTQQMGTVELTYDGLSLILNGLGEEASINGRMDESLLSYQGQISSFLNRKRLLLKLEPEGRPDRLEIRLTAQEGQITIYDCNFPYANRSDNSESRIIIGNHPIFPLELDLTVTLDTRPTMELIFTYEAPPLEAPEITNKQALITHRLLLKENLDLSQSEGIYSFPGEEGR